MKTAEKGIDWQKLTGEDIKKISSIVARAKHYFPALNPCDLIMDISACHIARPLDLSALLNADNWNFHHDICGISKNIDRKTGEMKHFFLPRYTLLTSLIGGK